jgi:hypothetical protein
MSHFLWRVVPKKKDKAWPPAGGFYGPDWVCHVPVMNLQRFHQAFIALSTQYPAYIRFRLQGDSTCSSNNSITVQSVE